MKLKMMMNTATVNCYYTRSMHGKSLKYIYIFTTHTLPSTSNESKTLEHIQIPVSGTSVVLAEFLIEFF